MTHLQSAEHVWERVIREGGDATPGPNGSASARRHIAIRKLRIAPKHLWLSLRLWRWYHHANQRHDEDHQAWRQPPAYKQAFNPFRNRIDWIRHYKSPDFLCVYKSQVLEKTTIKWSISQAIHTKGYPHQIIIIGIAQNSSHLYELPQSCTEDQAHRYRLNHKSRNLHQSSFISLMVEKHMVW